MTAVGGAVVFPAVIDRRYRKASCAPRRHGFSAGANPAWPRPAGARFFDTSASPINAARWTDASLAVVEKLLPLAEARHVPLSQYALAWVMHQPGVTSPIVGPRTFEQLEDNLEALDLKLSAAELRRIDDIVPPGTHTSPYYEADFGPHRYRW